jgi:hypothetical protein
MKNLKPDGIKEHLEDGKENKKMFMIFLITHFIVDLAKNYSPMTTLLFHTKMENNIKKIKQDLKLQNQLTSLMKIILPMKKSKI